MADTVGKSGSADVGGLVEEGIPSIEDYIHDDPMECGKKHLTKLDEDEACKFCGWASELDEWISDVWMRGK